MSKKFFIEDIELAKTFIEEWTECLDGLEKEILKLEVHSDDCDLVNDIFRRVHSIKGGSSFVGLSCITEISHEAESTLDAIRKGMVCVTSELIDSILSAVDYLNSFIAKLYKVLKEHDLPGESNSVDFEYDDEQKEELVLNSLMLTRHKCEIDKNNNPDRIIEQETDGLEILQSEEFKRTLVEGMREQFLLENIEHIERIENELLVKLDKDEHDIESINEIFRAVHSIKGGTGIYLAALMPKSDCFPVLKAFSEVAHNYENLLSLIRDGKLKFEKSIVDLSYEVVDYLKTTLNAVSCEVYESLPVADILKKINESILYLKTVSTAEIMNNTDQQTKLEPVKIKESQQKSNITQSIRVSQEKLDKMMNTISELLITKNSFLHISTEFNVDYDIKELSKEVKKIGESISRISDELQNSIMSMRMVEIKSVFQKMPRVVRDISKNSSKKMELIMQGEDTEIDKTIVEQISDPLIHLIRNAADHGIEAPDVRQLKGKPETGKIVLRAYNKNKHVYIEIEDDGSGIDANIMKKNAIEKGFITEAEAQMMNDNQLINLIFLPGFSTAKEITEVSGRGVGMDVVKSNIESIKGNVTIESKVGQGTKMIIQLPLTLAVARGLVAEVSGETYIFPLEYIVETVKLKTSSIHTFNDKYFVQMRGNVIGVEWLSKIFLIGQRNTENDDLNAVIISSGSENFAIIVDKLKNEQEFVVKTFDGALSSIPGISGSTLLGNGKVVLILNPADIVQLIKK